MIGSAECLNLVNLIATEVPGLSHGTEYVQALQLIYDHILELKEKIKQLEVKNV